MLHESDQGFNHVFYGLLWIVLFVVIPAAPRVFIRHPLNDRYQQDTRKKYKAGICDHGIYEDLAAITELGYKGYKEGGFLTSTSSLTCDHGSMKLL